MSVLIANVKSVCFDILKSSPPQVLVEAKGEVSTGGWSNPMLAPRFYIVPPEDGIQEFDFVATPPSPGTIVTQGFKEVSAESTGVKTDWMKGVRVYAAANAIEVLFTETACVVATCDIGDFQPWPVKTI